MEEREEGEEEKKEQIIFERRDEESKTAKEVASNEESHDKSKTHGGRHTLPPSFDATHDRSMLIGAVSSDHLQHPLDVTPFAALAEEQRIRKLDEVKDGTASNQELFDSKQQSKDSANKAKPEDERQSSCKCVQYFYVMVNSVLFTVIITLLILANTVLLALDRYPADATEVAIVEKINQAFTWCFFVEMIFKIIGLGIRGYLRDRFNLFDCFIVILSLVELLMETVSFGDGISSGGTLSAFRAVRLLRVFKLARSWRSFQIILIKIANSLKDIANFAVLLALFIFTFTLLSLELFSGNLKFDEQGNLDAARGSSPRTNFDTFVNALTTIFIILIGDDWNTIMMQLVRANGYPTLVFTLSVVVLGNFVLLSLFLAILLKNFEDDQFEKKSEEEPSNGVLSMLKSKLKDKILGKKIAAPACPSPGNGEASSESEQPSKSSGFSRLQALANAIKKKKSQDDLQVKEDESSTNIEPTRSHKVVPSDGLLVHITQDATAQEKGETP